MDGIKFWQRGLAPFATRLPAFILLILLLSQYMGYERVSAYISHSTHAIPATYWSHNFVQPHPTTTALPISTYPSSSRRSRTVLHAGKQPFNPFSQRSRNTRVKWYPNRHPPPYFILLLIKPSHTIESLTSSPITQH